MTIIAAYTSDDINSAGSRLRSFYLFKSAHLSGVTVRRNLSFVDSFKCDQIHLQKCYKPKHLIQALLFKIIGRQVVFDICDLSNRWSHRVSIVIAMIIASVVVTDTDARAGYCRKYVPAKKVHVLPDVLDLDPERIGGLENRKVFPKNAIYWTGHRGNLDSIADLLDLAKNRDDFHMIVITNLEGNDPLHKLYPFVTFIQWTLDCLFCASIDFGFMVLNHNWKDDPDSLFKSENKMVLAIAAGLVPIVSRSPAYERLAKELGAERLIFDKFDEVFDIISSLDSSWIQKFLAHSRDQIIRNYSCENVFKKYRLITQLRA